MTNPKHWNRRTIVAALHEKGMTITALPTVYGLPASGFKNIWARENEKAERAIADFLGVPVEVLFRDRYPKRKTRILDPKYLAESSRRVLPPQEAA